MNIQTLLVELLNFINTTLVPLVLALAFVAFLWNITRYFIFNISEVGDSKKGTSGGPQKARTYAMWSLLGFVVIFTIWGILNLLIGDFGIGGRVDPIPPDYMTNREVQEGFRNDGLPF